MAEEGGPATFGLGTLASPPDREVPAGAEAAPRADRRRRGWRLTRWWRSSSSQSWLSRTPRPPASPGPGIRRLGWGLNGMLLLKRDGAKLNYRSIYFHSILKRGIQLK